MLLTIAVPRTLWVFLVCLLAACGSNAPAPIEDRNAPGALRADQRYTVLPGDTLYAIAFRFGLDVRGLAAANSMVSPFTIYPGQTLRLAEAAVLRAPAPATGEKITAPAPREVTKTPVSSGAASAAAVASSPSSAQSQTPSPTTSREKPGATATAAAPKTAPTRAPVTQKVGRGAAVGRWQWPAQGRVTRSFDTSLHKGIDIGGARGDPVLATATGEVVYAGSGIAGYGLMLIIRHNQTYLSAYGHNDSLLVKEGDAVTAGQLIARRGSTGTDSVKLHFEIRRQGRPVDPRGLLPRR